MAYSIEEILHYGREWSFHKTSPNGRWRSWEHCYTVFSSCKGVELSDADYDFLALHLGFYLASWGMYRGSCFVLHRDYKIHIPAVKAIMNPDYHCLWDIKCADYLAEPNNLTQLMAVSYDLMQHYDPIRDEVSVALGKEEPESDLSQTLITKILMGTMGCVPAYDTLFVKGRRGVIRERSYSRESITALSKLWVRHEVEFEALRAEVSSPGLLYPQMKVIDMCFNSRGQ